MTAEQETRIKMMAITASSSTSVKTAAQLPA